jgi:hypothetical protein
MKRFFILTILALLLIGTASAITETTTFFTNDTGASDGSAQYVAGGANWATIRGGGGNGASTGAASAVTDLLTFNTPDTFIRLQRGILIFNTAVLPDDAIISSAVIQLYYVDSMYQLGDTGLGITPFTIDGGISADDFDNINDTLISNYNNISTLIAWKDWTLTSDGRNTISKTGLTGFMVRIQPDITNVAPTWQSSKSDMYTFRAMTFTSFQPRLIVTYTHPSPSDIYISSITSVTNKGATVNIAGATSSPVWVKYGQTPQGMTWKSQNTTAAGTASVLISGGNILTNSVYYAHACQSTGCNTSYSMFTTSAPGAVTQPNLGSGFDNLTESDFNLFNVMPDVMTPYTTVIPLNIFFGIILGLIVMGMWAANKSTRLISILMIIAAPLLFSAGSGLNIGIPGAMQALGEACLAIGLAGALLSLIRR